VELTLSVDERIEVVPAHAWTPWFSVFGSKGGFDSLAEAFGDMLSRIHAVETGLSSDPDMNWRVPELDGLTIVSYSDAHSLERMGRELTVFEGKPSYDGFREALRRQQVAYTVEFYPEEGKYQFDGHREHGVTQAPGVSIANGGRCPVCGHQLTLGVAYKNELLAKRPHRAIAGGDGMLRDPEGKRPPFARLVPLDEILAQALGKGRATRAVRDAYDALVRELGGELAVLRVAALGDIECLAGGRIADGVRRVRAGEVDISPGYDGVYGTVRIWPGNTATARRSA